MSDELVFPYSIYRSLNFSKCSFEHRDLFRLAGSVNQANKTAFVILQVRIANYKGRRRDNLAANRIKSARTDMRH